MTDSTELSERTDPEILRALMLRYFEEVSACVARHGGTVEKYIGDAVMAVFGVPEIREDDALRAVCAAVEIQRTLRGLRLAGASEPATHVRIGINTGSVVATTDVSGRQALVAGRTVNVAARLEQSAAPGEILAGDITYQLVARWVVATRSESVRVKGIAAPVRTWIISDVLRGRLSLGQRSYAPLVGRDKEMRRLERAFDEVRETFAVGLCTVLGEPGVGKTRLAREFAARLRGRGVPVAYRHCLENGNSETLGPVLDALRELTGREAFESDGWRDLTPEERLWLIRERTHCAIGAEGALVVIDDLHLAGTEVTELIEHLVDRLRQTPIMFLCLGRFELLTRRSTWGGGLPCVTSWSLGGLSAEDSRRLVGQLVDFSLHGTGTIESIGISGEGSPFLIEQLVAACRAGMSPDELPASIQTLLSARIDRLNDDERHVLTWCSVIGDDVKVPMLQSLTGLARLDECLASLSRLRLLDHVEQDAYRFRSQQVRAIAYEGQVKSLRAERHHAVARCLDDNDIDKGRHLARAFDYWQELKHHGPEAESVGRDAGRVLLRSARNQWHLGNTSTSLGLYEEAMQMPLAKSEEYYLAALADMTDAAAAAGKRDSALATADRLLSDAEICGSSRFQAHAKLRLAALHVAEQGGPSLAAVASSAAEEFEAAGDIEGLTLAWLRLGNAAQWDTDHQGATTWFERVLEVSEASGRPHGRIVPAMAGLATSLLHGPAPLETGIARCWQLTADFGTGHPSAKIVVGCPLAEMLAARSDELALQVISDAVHAAQEFRSPEPLAAVAFFGGVTMMWAGHFEEASKRLADAMRNYVDMNATMLRDVAAIEMARCQLYLGHRELASEIVEECGLLDSGALQPERALGLSLRARLRADRDNSEPMRDADEALSIMNNFVSPTRHGMVLLDRAHLFAELGDTERGRSAAEQARVHFSSKGHRAGGVLVDSFLNATQ